MNLDELSKVGAVVKNHKATIPDFTKFYDVTIMNPRVLVGAFMGVMLAFVFCAMTMKAVGRAASKMVEEVRRQFPRDTRNYGRGLVNLSTRRVSPLARRRLSRKCCFRRSLG